MLLVLTLDSILMNFRGCNLACFFIDRPYKEIDTIPT